MRACSSKLNPHPRTHHTLRGGLQGVQQFSLASDSVLQDDRSLSKKQDTVSIFFVYAVVAIPGRRSKSSDRRSCSSCLCPTAPYANKPTRPSASPPSWIQSIRRMQRCEETCELLRSLAFHLGRPLKQTFFAVTQVRTVNSLDDTWPCLVFRAGVP